MSTSFFEETKKDLVLEKVYASRPSLTRWLSCVKVALSEEEILESDEEYYEPGTEYIDEDGKLCVAEEQTRPLQATPDIEKLFLDAEDKVLRVIKEHDTERYTLNDEQYEKLYGVFSILPGATEALGNVDVAEAFLVRIEAMFTAETMPVIANDITDDIIDEVVGERLVMAYRTHDFLQWTDSGVSLIHKVMEINEVEFSTPPKKPFPTVYPVVLYGSWVLFNHVIKYDHVLLPARDEDIITTGGYELRSCGKAAGIRRKDNESFTYEWNFTIDEIKHSAGLGGVYVHEVHDDFEIVKRA